MVSTKNLFKENKDETRVSRNHTSCVDLAFAIDIDFKNYLSIVSFND